MHYQRLMETGSTDRPISSAPDEERFWVKVSRGTGCETTCWLWLGGISKQTGYGHFWLGGKTHLAHRVAHEYLIGPIARDLTLDHLRDLCGNRHCVKVVEDEWGPAHLEPVTHRVNNIRADGVSGVNFRKTHCIRGHEFTPENTYHPPKRPEARNCRQCMAIHDAAARARRRSGA
jgi:hypothetical protein